MSLSKRQRREVETAVRHIGRAMRALQRADLPWPNPTYLAGVQDAFAFYDGERRLGQASNRLIDGLECLDAESIERGQSDA